MIPRWFGHLNKHGVPDRAMAYNVVCSIIVLLFGSPLRIYIFSNVGYLFACMMAFFAYFAHRQTQPSIERPVRLPGFMRWLALAVGIVCAVVLVFRRVEQRVRRARHHGSRPVHRRGTHCRRLCSPAHVAPVLRPAQTRGTGGTVVAGGDRSRTGAVGVTSAIRRLGRRGDRPPDSPRDVVVVLRPDSAASPELFAAARATGGTVAVVLPLKIHGYSLGMPNPGLMPTARERKLAEEAITTTVRRLRNAGTDVDGQIVVTRHAHRAVTGIVRRRGANRVLLEEPTTSSLRRFVEGDLHRQLSRGLGRSAEVHTPAEAGVPPAS